MNPISFCARFTLFDNLPLLLGRNLSAQGAFVEHSAVCLYPVISALPNPVPTKYDPNSPLFIKRIRLNSRYRVWVDSVINDAVINSQGKLWTDTPPGNTNPIKLNFDGVRLKFYEWMDLNTQYPAIDLAGFLGYFYMSIPALDLWYNAPSQYVGLEDSVFLEVEYVNSKEIV